MSVTHLELRPKRKSYKVIMELAWNAYDTKSILRSIQKVRMALGVVHLSKTCAANRIQLDKQFLSSKLTNVVRNSDMWPVNHHVISSDYSHWRKFIKCIFSGVNSTLTTPLGNWVNQDQLSWKNHWDFFLSSNREFLLSSSQKRSLAQTSENITPP